jgi:hypothetical protein
MIDRTIAGDSDRLPCQLPLQFAMPSSAWSTSQASDDDLHLHLHASSLNSI